MRRHPATFTRQPRLSLYTLATEPPQVVASTQVSASVQVVPSSSCRLLSHQTLLKHHRLGQPSLPRQRGMHSRLLVFGLPRSLPPLPPSPSPPYLPCIEGRQRAAPHSSSFPPTTAPLQTLHMDVWGPARVNGQGHERYFLLVVDDYMRYTTVFPLRSKGEVPDVLIPWICAVCLQLGERFVLRLHSDRGGEFSSDILRDIFCGEGITQSFTLLASPHQNGILERRIVLVMEVARTSMIHAAAPHFLWSFVVRYAEHQLNLWPRVSLPETSPTLRWMGTVGDASVFRVWGSRAFVRDTSADKLSARAIPCIFLRFPPHAPGWQFYHPTSRSVLFSQDVTFDKSVPFYRLFPYRSAPPTPPPLFLAPGPTSVYPPPGAVPVEVSGDSGAASGAASGGVGLGGEEPVGAESEGAGSGGAAPRGAEPAGVETGGAEPEGVEPGGAEPEGTVSRPETLSLQQLHEWLVRRARPRSGAAGAGGTGDTGAGGAGVNAGAGGIGGTADAGPGGARTWGTGAAETGGVGGAGARDPTEPGAVGAGGTKATGSGVGGTGAGGSGARCTDAGGTGAGGARAADLGARGAGTGGAGGTGAGTSSLPAVPDPESDLVRGASPTVSRLLATAVTDPSFESTAMTALVPELLDFAAPCHLDYTYALVVDYVSATPPSVEGECALCTDVLQDRREDFECLAAALPCFASMLLAPEGDPDAPDIPTMRSYVEAITGPYSSQWKASMDVEMASWKSTGTYVNAVLPSRVNIVDGMWISRVKRPPGSPPAFKARYVA
ncbi:unnamed protein product [Closterium sp. NIES-54]